MPSHITHLLFAERSVRECGLDALAAPPLRRYLVLGAQGPDIFYHNQRRRPTGLAYGSLMHRHGYGSAVALMVDWACAHGYDRLSWPIAWAAGFAGHAILDRATHPFINAHSGWVDQNDPATARYRSMHPFLERLIDVELLRRDRGCHPNDIDFHSQVDCGDDPPGEWVAMMASALRQTYRKAERDDLLERRLESAYLDTIGYYRFTNLVDTAFLERGLAREQTGGASSLRWLSIVHPPEVPQEIDVLNLQQRLWAHPCDPADTRTSSFVDLYESALAPAVEAIGAIVSSFDSPRDDARSLIERTVANHNLSDGRPTERPCRKVHATPLPLPELRDRIADSIRAGRGGRLGSVSDRAD
ncbi:MAG: hypothetical protein EA382_02575 [Spirochaetaceae bacterium]|nr:MAG: hypothetical protein EA382_02575 [Spirochaetaceae bacterium]